MILSWSNLLKQAHHSGVFRKTRIGVWGFELRVWGLGFRAEGLGLRVEGLELRV